MVDPLVYSLDLYIGIAQYNIPFIIAVVIGPTQ